MFYFCIDINKYQNRQQMITGQKFRKKDVAAIAKAAGCSRMSVYRVIKGDYSTMAHIRIRLCLEFRLMQIRQEEALSEKLLQEMMKYGKEIKNATI